MDIRSKNVKLGLTLNLKMKQKLTKKEFERSFKKCMDASLIVSVEKHYGKEPKLKIINILKKI